MPTLEEAAKIGDRAIMSVVQVCAVDLLFLSWSLCDVLLCVLCCVVFGGVNVDVGVGVDKRCINTRS